MFYSDRDIERIKAAADGQLLPVVESFRTVIRKSGEYVCDCPSCGGLHKMKVNPKKNVAKCFSCNFGTGGKNGGEAVLNYLMKAEGMDFVKALQWMSDRYGITPLDGPDTSYRPVKQKPVPAPPKEGSPELACERADTFCARMLAESGLTYRDVTAKIYLPDENRTVTEAKTFRPGTVNAAGEIVPGDDAVICYYDLDGAPVIFYRKEPGKNSHTYRPHEYYRVRWQYPDEHKDKEGRPYKYKSPAGSGTPIYIPDAVRQAYHNHTPLPRLCIQEGEKKAEKACKHGILSIAVSGIQNLGQRDKRLPEDLIRIIERCGVKEVLFMFDSDWNDLSHEIMANKPVDSRPRCFFSAARNFKEYIRSLVNRNLYVDSFIGYVLKNPSGEKGIDDLLTGSMRGKESELEQDIGQACNDKSGRGQYVQVHKVTSWSDNKLSELWGLSSPQDFARMHFDTLKNVPDFMYGRYRWKFDDDGNLVSALPFDEDEKFWIETETENRSGETVWKVEYDYVAGKKFLERRGVGIWRDEDIQVQRSSSMQETMPTFVHHAPPVLKVISIDEARDFIYKFAEEHCSHRVNNMLLRGGAQYVGPHQMKRLEAIRPRFRTPRRDEQYMYFRNAVWRISEDKTEQLSYEVIDHTVWEEQIRPAKAEILPPLISFTLEDTPPAPDGEKPPRTCRYTLSDDGRECDFLRFLINASNFTWRRERNGEAIDEEDLNENRLHLLSKLTAIGYMSMEAKDRGTSKAVIGMDGKMSEVGDSNGRSGKSLVGELMRHIESSVYIPGKNNDIFKDQFVWNDITERSRLVFIDDVRQCFDFEFVFPFLSGDWTVNKKGGERFTIPFSKSPKMYISTNHAIRGEGSSFKDRQWLIAFSDYYNDRHKPADDFGGLFFDDWDYRQWNLCWNLIACCIRLYLKFGVIQAPGERLEQRRKRQEVGETVIAWADEYFSNPEHFNTRIPRNDMYQALIDYDKAQRKFVPPASFKKRLRGYCDLKGYVFNPQKWSKNPGGGWSPSSYNKDGAPILDDKSNGVEYFAVSASYDDYYNHTPLDPMGIPAREEDKLDF